MNQDFKNGKEEARGKQDSGTLRVSKHFRELIEELKVAEEKRGNGNCSDSTATEILYRRIINAGGLKPVK